LFTCVCFKVHVYQCVSKFLSPCVCLKALVYQLCVSKLLSTFVCVKFFVYLCMSQSFYLPLFVYMNFGRFMSFEIHHKHGIFYHIIFAKVYQRLWIFKLLKVHLLCATIIIKVHKRNVSPQNHSHDTTLNDHYVYQFIYFGEFIFSFNTYILCDWNGFDCLWFGWFKHVLKCLGTCFRNVVPLRNFIEKVSIGITIFVQIDSYFNHK